MEKLNVILTSFIVALIGITLLISLANNNYDNTTLVTGYTASFTASNTSCVKVTTGCIDTITKVVNSTQATVIGARNYSLCRSDGVNANGIILDGSGVTDDALYNGATLNATYQFSPQCQYVQDATSRTLLPIIILFFVIAILLAAGYWLFQKGAFDF